MSAVTVESLELSQIVPSSTNPRKSFDPVALEQLAESIKEIGITVPILVRPWPKNKPMSPPSPTGRYELISGHRRLKAAAIAGLKTIPAFIRELHDAEAQDIQMVENLQRADLHPMDEAAGYQALIDAAADRGVALTQEELAHKVGKPLSYVAQRVKLLDLAETPRKVFQEGHINIGHALLLARLTPELQDEGLCAIFDPMKQYRKNGKKTASPAEVVKASIKAAKNFYSGPREAARPATEFKGWIKQNVELDLKQAPWDLGDEHMHPEAGSCVQCPKRSGNNPALFAELTTGEDKCTDPACFDLKAKTFVQIKLKAQTSTGKPMLNLSQNWSYDPLDGTEKKIKRGQWEQAKKGECPDSRQGVMSEGGEMGKVLWVCINQKCKKHEHTVQRPASAQTSSSSSRPKPPKGMTQEEFKAQQERASKRKAAEQKGLYLAIREAYANEVNRETAMLEYIARAIDNVNSEDPSQAFDLNNWKMTQHWEKDLVFLVDKLKTLKGSEFVSFLFDLMYGDMSDADSWQDFTKRLKELAEKYGVDPADVAQQVMDANPELYDEPKPKPEPEAKPAKGKKAAKSKATPAQKKKVADATKKAVVDRKSAAAGDDDDDDELPDFGEPKDDRDNDDFSVHGVEFADDGEEDED